MAVKHYHRPGKRHREPPMGRTSQVPLTGTVFTGPGKGNDSTTYYCLLRYTGTGRRPVSHLFDVLSWNGTECEINESRISSDGLRILNPIYGRGADTRLEPAMTPSKLAKLHESVRERLGEASLI